MTIQSLGVGSGLALDDLVQQLLEAERAPKDARLNEKEERIEAEISGLGQIKSKLSAFEDSVDELRSDADINGREPTISNPSEDDDVLSAEASNSALRGSYEITVEQLASGSRITTDDGPMALYRNMALACQQWDTKGNLGLVVGATVPEQLKEIRAVCPNMPFLIPGVGAQGGDLEAAVRLGADSRGRAALINSSRGIIYASNGPDFAQAAAREADKLRTSINQVLEADGKGWP